MERGEALLDAIIDDVTQRLNPEGDECPHCGGDGETFDCFDGMCVEADYGCPDCRRRCTECARHELNFRKAVREDVIALGDADVAIAWLKWVDRWDDTITRGRVLDELKKAAPTKRDLREVLSDALKAKQSQ